MKLVDEMVYKMAILTKAFSLLLRVVTKSSVETKAFKAERRVYLRVDPIALRMLYSFSPKLLKS